MQPTPLKHTKAHQTKKQHNIKHTIYGSHSGLQYLFEMLFSVANILRDTMKKHFLNACSVVACKGTLGFL